MKSKLYLKTAKIGSSILRLFSFVRVYLILPVFIIAIGFWLVDGTYNQTIPFPKIITSLLVLIGGIMNFLVMLFNGFKMPVHLHKSERKKDLQESAIHFGYHDSKKIK
ncbi:MAG: DUF5317 family protein, partial [Candidatus Paceibacterota bacterium]